MNQKMDTGERNTLIGLFKRSAEHYPDKPALEIGHESWSYRDLDREAVKFASLLESSDVDTRFIAILAERSLTAYSGILGTLMAGAAYLPLNLRFPVARNIYMLEKAEAGTLVVGPEGMIHLEEILEKTSRPMKVLLAEGIEKNELQEKYVRHKFFNSGKELHSNRPGSVNSIAYLMFTSGSTGSPKGVPVSNHNAVHYVRHMTGAFRFLPGERFSQTFDLTFDLSVHDLFVCWASGGCLCVPPDNSSFGLARFIKEKKPSVWFSVPSVAMLMKRMRLLRQEAFKDLKYSFFCGEPLYKEVAAEWSRAANNSFVINLYGPTEATIAVSSYELPKRQDHWKERNGILSIGKVFPGHRVSLKGNEGIDEGELCLSGPQVVSGYLREDELTGRSFFDEDGWWYRTGDLVARDNEGDLFFLGRNDAEVKISGYRVNLMEVEHALSIQPEIHQAVCIYLSGQAGGLIAFVTGTGDRLANPVLLDSRCRHILPWYMVPEKIIFVEEIPLNPNGKTDKKALIEKYLTKG